MIPPSVSVLASSSAVTLALCVLVLSPSLGGYGLIAWSLHPLLLILGLALLLPLALDAETACSPLVAPLARRLRLGARGLRESESCGHNRL